MKKNSTTARSKVKLKKSDLLVMTSLTPCRQAISLTVNLTISLLLSMLYSQSTQASFDPYQVYSKQRFDFSLDSSFYKTTANFNADGEKVDLFSGNSFQLIDINPQLRWGLQKNLGLRVGGHMGISESVDPLNTRTNSTLSRIDLAADYLLFGSDSSGYSGQFQAIIDLEISQPIDKVDPNGDSVLNNDGATEIKPTVIGRMNFEQFYPYAYVGLNSRSEGLSTLLNYGVGSEFRFSELGLGAALEGFATIKDDEFTNAVSRRDNLTTRVNAGSKKFYSVNPNLLAAEVFLNFAMTQEFKLKIYGGADLIGSNISQGYFLGGTLTYILDFSKPTATPSKKKRPRFQEDTDDGVSQDYFKPVAPPEDNQYVQPIEEDMTTYESNSEDKIQVDSGVQDDLDQVGYTLKLKKINKKKKKKQAQPGQ